MAGFVAKILKSALGIFTSRVFGLVRDVSVAGFFGATAATDAFFVAFAVPNLFRAFFAEGALSSVFVPFLSDRLKNNGEKSASIYLSSLILSVSVIIMLIITLVFIFPETTVSVFMPGYAKDRELVTHASKMIYYLMPYLLLITFCALLTSYINLKNSYYIPSASTAILNIAMIAGAWIGYANGLDIIYLCYGMFFGGILQFAAVFAYAVKKGFRPSLVGGYDKSVNQIFYLIIPSLIGVGINQFNFLVGRIAASFLSIGSISYLYYANRLFQFPLGMFAVAVGTVTLTEISVANSNGEYNKRNQLIDKAINAVLLVMVPSAAGLIILAEPIIDMVYGRINFRAADVLVTASALRMYSSGLLFYSFISVFSRIYYSDRDVSTPVKAAGLGFAVNLALNFALLKMGTAGIALASSLAALVNFAFLYFKLKNYTYRLTLLTFKMLAAAVVMSLSVYFINGFGIHVLASVAGGCVIYLIALIIMGVDFRRVLR